MAIEQKVVEYANFNITFGDDNSPMLEHFEDYIFKAFTDETLRRETNQQMPFYSFYDVCLKWLDGEFVLVGNFVKQIEHEIYTVIKDNHLEEHRAKVPTAPYSRFIIFLKNHRMILIKNESASPNLKSFNTTVKSILIQYRYKENKKRKKENKELLPDAIVNILGIPLKENIELALKNVRKIESVRLRMFPLNNDRNPSVVAEAAHAAMKTMGANTGNINFNSPQSRSGVISVVEESSGMAEVTIKGITSEGGRQTIKGDALDAKSYYPLDKNISPDMDLNFIKHAKNTNVNMPTSDENRAKYNSMIGIFKYLLNKLVGGNE